MKNKELYNKIEKELCRSAWGRGVKEYALEMVESAESVLEYDKLKETLLNGASDWNQYSYGGCSLIYDGDIAERLCSPSELKKTRNGERNPNGRETWLDCQARALHQAFNLVKRNLRHLPSKQAA